MKSFAHPGTASAVPMSLNKMLADTIAVAAHELRSAAAEVRTEFGELAPRLGFPADLNQAFLNLVINAAHAIADRQLPADPGVIKISTRQLEDEAGASSF